MSLKEELTILWTNGDPVTAEYMVLMYAVNSIKNSWWEKVEIVVWGGATKLVQENRHIREKLLEAIRAGLAALGGLNVLAYPRHLQMEISRAGATKSWGIQALCAHLGIEAREVLALGDSDNDLDLLSWAGCSVAMANGSPLARQAADMVTAANDEGGVARAVEALMDRIGNG